MDLDLFGQILDLPELANGNNEAVEKSKINNGLDFSRLLTDDYFQKPVEEIHCRVEEAVEAFEEIKQEEIREMQS